MSFLRKMLDRRKEVEQFAVAEHTPDPSLGDGSSVEILQLANEIGRLAPQQASALLKHLRDGLNELTAEVVRYQAAEALSSAVYPKYKFSEFGRIFLEDDAFLKYYVQFMDVGNWHSLDRKYTLNQLLKLTLHLEGDVVECGVYKGASAFIMCQAHRDTGRIVHLFDSFEGLSAPGRCDGDYWAQGALAMSEQMLRESLAEFTNYHVYKGWIPERFCEMTNDKLSFLHIDVDLYQPTLASLEFFYGRMVTGAVLLFDDYGFSTCPGAKRAVDEFFLGRPEQIVMLPTGQAFTVKQ